MTAVVASDCAGLWRRTLLVTADGSRDSGAGVVWLQGCTAFVDSRGFAGTLHQDGDVFEWRRAVDLHPPAEHPDAGEMRWEGDTLIETGVHEDYVEHWVRDPGPTWPVGAAFVRGPDGGTGLVVRVGNRFAWAGGDVVAIDDVGGPRWTALEIGRAQIRANGVRWIVERIEGNLES